jgi:hypothetical protein
MSKPSDGRIIVLFTRHYKDDPDKENELGRACSLHELGENCVQDLVREPERKRPIGKPMRGWEETLQHKVFH